MLRQSLDFESGTPMDIGADAHPLWHASPSLLSGSGHRLGTCSGVETSERVPHADFAETDAMVGPETGQE